MTTLHVYSNLHIKHQVKSIKTGDWIYLENGMSRKRWSSYFSVNNFNKDALNIKYITHEDFFELSEIKFDVIVGNPPYNSDDTQRKNSAHRGQGDNLAKQFTVKALDLLKEGGEMVFIIPYGHRTYSPRLAEKYRKNGLYKIEDVADSFKGVSTNPCAFHFKKGQVVDLVEDQYNTHTRIVPTNNIGNIFRNQPGVLNRIDFEHKLKDTGKYRIVVTTAIQKYTDDKTIVDRMKDKTHGTWRVVFNCTTSKGKFGKIIVEGPSSVLSKSVHCLICESKEQAERLKTYLETTDVQQILADVKLNACNSKKFLKYIPMPTK